MNLFYIIGVVVVVNRGRRVPGSTPLNKEFDTTKSALFNFLDMWLEPARFYADVQYVMALRMMRLALGGSPAATEARQMVSEKVSALKEAQVAIVTALATGSGLSAATAWAYAPYRRGVRADRLRLDSLCLRG